MEKKKIIFFIYELGSGGAARTIVNIVNHMDRDLFEPIIVTLNYEGSYEKYLREDLRLVKLETKRLRSAIAPFRDLIKEERPHIVFSTIPNYNTIAILSRLLSKTKAKSVVREAAYLGGGMKENVKLFLYGRLYRFTSGIVALSKGVKENIVKRYRVSDKKIRVIYNPIDLQEIESQMLKKDLPKEHEALFEGPRKVIVTAGRLVKEKDQATLIKAFAKTNEKIPSRLLILGDGQLREQLATLARELNVANHVHFLGFQQNPYAYFHRADVFALSSTTEGFGHVLVEALATETLVVSTDCKPGSTEVLQDGKYGWVSPVGDEQQMADHLKKALSIVEDERQKQIAAGKKWVESFSAERIVKQYEDLFLEIIGVDK